MKYALLSDIHSNLHALDACLAHAHTQGAERIAILGDMVSYGAFPSEVVARCQALQYEGAIVLRGNHEELVQTHHVNTPNPSLGSQTAQWTHDQLSPAQRFWLETRPLTERVDQMFFVHASADAPERWRYVDDERTAGLSLDAACAHPDVRYVFGGHVHYQSLYYRGTGRQLMAFKPTSGVPIPTPSTASGLPPLAQWVNPAMAIRAPCMRCLTARQPSSLSIVWPTTTAPLLVRYARQVCLNFLRNAWRLANETARGRH